MIKRRKPLLQPRRQQRIWRSQLYIRAHRQTARVSLSELAKAIGQTKGNLSSIETGRWGASLETLADIAEYLGLEHAGKLFDPPEHHKIPPGWRRVVSYLPDNNH